MQHDSLLPFDLPAVAGKKITAAFDGGRLTSNAGVLLLREVERRLGIAERLAACLTDRRDASRIEHGLAEMARFRMFAIAAGYEDACDCDALRDDPAFKMAVARLPESGHPLCSQPTMSRLENAPGWRVLPRLMAAMADLFCAGWKTVPERIVLDIDDTWDETHGAQQLSLFNAHYDGYGFLPVHIYGAIPTTPGPKPWTGWRRAASLTPSGFPAVRRGPRSAVMPPLPTPPGSSRRRPASAWRSPRPASTSGSSLTWPAP